MTLNELLSQLEAKGFDTAKVTKVIVEKWHGNIFKFFVVPVEINDRYKSTAGKAVFTSGGEPVKIILAERLFKNGWQFVFNTLVHEIAHLLNPFDNHGHWWRTDDLSMGGDGCETHTLPFMPRHRRPFKVVGYCEKCGDEVMAKSYARRGYVYKHTYCGGRVMPIRHQGDVPMFDKARSARVNEFMERKASDDDRVIAVRDDQIVGNGSGSFVERLTDLEIMQELARNKIVKPTFARMYFRKLHRIKMMPRR